MKRILPSRKGGAADETGAITVLSLFLVIAVLVVGGLGLDVAGAIQQRTQLQVAADTAAHAALYTRWRGDPSTEEAAKTVAVSYAALNMPVSRFGNVLARQDIEFGLWNENTRVFTPQPGSTEAVRVTTLRAQKNQNPMGTNLLWLVGLGAFNLYSDSVFAAYVPACMRQGMVAQNLVRFTSLNRFSNGYCIHSNGTISMLSNNTFETALVNDLGVGVTVSLPSGLAGIKGTNDPLASNPGLAQALRKNSYELLAVSELEATIAALSDPTHPGQPEYIQNTTVKVVKILTPNNNTKLYMNSFSAGTVHTMDCPRANMVVQLGGPISDIVLVTNCKIDFMEGSVIANSIIATTHTDVDSFGATHAFQLGRDDDCIAGNGTLLLTLGGARFASELSIDGSRVVGKKTIFFAAKPNGIHGASFISGDSVETTSDGTFAFCDDDILADALQPVFFHLVD